MLPITRSQKAFAVGACGGDFNTSIRQRATSSSKPREKVLWRSWSRNLYSRSPGSASRISHGQIALLYAKFFETASNYKSNVHANPLSLLNQIGLSMVSL